MRRHVGSYIICSICGRSFHKSAFKDGTFPTECSTCRGVDINPEIDIIEVEPVKEEVGD